MSGLITFCEKRKTNLNSSVIVLSEKKTSPDLLLIFSIIMDKFPA